MSETAQNTSSNLNQKAKGVIKGRDIQQSVTVSFEESALGCTKEITYARNENCETCDGTGVKPGSIPTKCMACDGKGYII